MAAERAAARPRVEPEDPAVLVERERRRSRPAAIAAAVAAVLPLVGGVISTVVPNDYADDSKGFLQFQDHNAVALIASTVLVGLGTLAMGYVIVFLYDATNGRRPLVPRIARLCALYAPFVLFVGLVGREIGFVVQAHDFVSREVQTNQAAKDLIGAPVLLAVQGLAFAAQLALGFSIAIVCLNAMRAGLLTRYMGIVGVAVGVLSAIPLAGGLGIGVTFLWFVALALLLAGRWPGGPPPAWARGEAIPWPSQQEQRERAALERSQRDGPSESSEDDDGQPEGEPEPAKANGTPHSSAKKRKRKRRR